MPLRCNDASVHHCSKQNNFFTQLLHAVMTVNNLFGFASPFANQYQSPANQCIIWFAETANQHVGQGTGLYVY